MKVFVVSTDHPLSRDEAESLRGQLREQLGDPTLAVVAIENILGAWLLEVPEMSTPADAAWCHCVNAGYPGPHKHGFTVKGA